MAPPEPSKVLDRGWKALDRGWKVLDRGWDLNEGGAATIGPMSTLTHARPRPRGASLDVLLVVALGGMLGATARHGMSELISVDRGAWPWDTFLENVSGAFLLGATLTELVRRFPASRYLRPFLAVGFLGSFTTFSALVVQADQLMRDGEAALAVGYWAGSIAAGLLGAWGGIACTRLLLRATEEPRR